MTVLPIKFDCRGDLLLIKDFPKIYNEFQKYKSISSVHSRPNNSYQKQYVSLSPLLGRDRFNADDKQEIELRREQLTHIHVKQKGCIWVDEDNDPLAQWECTSNSYLIYSYFVHNGTRYYFIITFIDDNAHVHWEDEKLKSLWLRDAKEYRISITKNQ